MLSQIIKLLGSDPSKPQSPTNRMGTGHQLCVGLQIQCAGLPDADGNPVRHLIGTLTGVPDEGAYFVPAERADEGTFVLDPSQSAINTTTFACTICGQPPIL